MVFSEFDKMKTNHLIIVISINTVSKSHSVVSNPLQPHGLQPTRLLHPWNSPGKSTGSGQPSPCPGDPLNSRMKPGLLHCRLILDHPSHRGKPSQHRAFVLLILFMMPVVSLFTQFTEPRVGKAQKLRGWRKTRGAQELLLLLLSRVSRV